MRVCLERAESRAEMAGTRIRGGARCAQLAVLHAAALARDMNARHLHQERPGARSSHLCTSRGSLAHLTSVQRWLERILGPILEKQRAGLARASEFACRSGRNAHRRRPAMRASGQLARRSARPRHERTPLSSRTPKSSLEPFPHVAREKAGLHRGWGYTVQVRKSPRAKWSQMRIAKALGTHRQGA